MNENQGTNPIAAAQNFVTAKTPEELQEAVKAIHLDCLTQPVDAIRELAKHLESVNKATLMDRVREEVKNGGCAENASVALEDAENLVNPVLPAPIFSTKARQMALDVKYLSSLGDYCNQRVQMLDEIQHLTGEEAEAISSRLVERLGDLLIFEALVDNTDGDKVLARQVRLWQMLHMAREEGQMQLTPYFLALDEEDNVQSLLPCCIPMGAPAKVFYSCAGILKALAYQQDVWEYDALVNALHEKVQTEVLQRVSRGKDDENTRLLAELFALLRVVVSSHSPAVWDYPRFEEIKKKLEGN
jgi:hypothetical protein